jgi:hypothetical protein
MYKSDGRYPAAPLGGSCRGSSALLPVEICSEALRRPARSEPRRHHPAMKSWLPLTPIKPFPC